MRKVKKPVFFIVLLCIIAFGYLTYAGIHTQYGDIKTSYIKGVEDIRWGIDIQGGVNATFEPADNYDATKEEMDAAKAVIEQRLVSLNITDSEVYVDYKKNKVMVSFPWQANEESFDPEAAVSELGETAKLVFRKGKEAEVRQTQDETTGNIKYVVSLTLNNSGKKAFADATTELAGKGSISIWMDDKCISAPSVNSAITDGECVIEGNFTYHLHLARVQKMQWSSQDLSHLSLSLHISSLSISCLALLRLSHL